MIVWISKKNSYFSKFYSKLKFSSDEVDQLCKNRNCTEPDCKESKVFCPPIISTRLKVTCELEDKGVIPCNQSLPAGTIAKFSCKYFLK